MISNRGNILSSSRIYPQGKHKIPVLKPERVMKNRIVRGYNYVMLDVNDGKIKTRKNMRVARLVATHFIRKPKDGEEVNHKNGKRLDDNIENLEWVTKSENIKHAYRLGLRSTPTGRMKFSRKKIDRVLELRMTGGFKHKEIAKKLGMGVSTITHILLGSRRLKQ